MTANQDRPDPDALLRRVQAEQERGSRATLKVFLGYAPGVGKTYTMLESARRLKDQGIDLAVGCVETHGRAETADLLAGLETLPRRDAVYRGARLSEFDLDRALARRPEVLLLDELAHTNAPGSRHAKRWQDVTELLDAGISVHTTLNVQHLESLNDVVAQITTVRVRETVPDSVLERADEIEIVDLPPEELLERLREGKVYVPDQARLAAGHFFRRGNLLALRELCLRRAAERIDADVLAYRRDHDIQATWPAAERILVCVGPSPSSARVIRGARRMAAGLRAPWVAAYADAPDAYPMTQEDRERLQAHLRLAESLGEEVLRLSGSHVSDELLGYAREHNVTRIVIGKPTHPWWWDMLRGSLVNQLVRGSGDLEVHFIAGDEPGPAPPTRPAPRRRGIDALAYLGAAGLVAVATGLAAAGRSYLSQPDVVMVYLFIIMVVAFRSDLGPSLAAAVLSVAAYDFVFVPPFFTFTVEHARHLLTFATMFGVGLSISSLTSRLRRQGRDARLREERTAALYSLTRKLAAVPDERQAADVIARHAAEVFGGEAAVLARDATGSLALQGASQPDLRFSDEELAVAAWACDHGRPAGAGTDTLPGIGVTSVPLQAGSHTLGALALRLSSLEILEVEQRHFLEAFVRQAAVSLERARLTEEAKASALKARAEELRSSLLSAVSHDLRTPLAAITGSATALRDDSSALGNDQRAVLLDTICVEAERMERLVRNILDVVRLESGGMQPKREWVPVEEIVGAALSRLARRIGERAVVVEIPVDLPLVPVDPVLLEQVIVNLVENVLQHTDREGPLEIGAAVADGFVEVEVRDRGPGFPPGSEARIFEKFYRGPGATPGGSGLGLAVCRGILTVHGGTIEARNRPGGGAVFRLRLPVGDGPPSIPDEDGMAATAGEG